MKLTIAEEITLLRLHDNDGSLLRIPDWSARYSMSGALLMELAEAGRIDSDLKKLYIVSTEPIGHPLVDDVLQSIASDPTQRDIRYWIELITDQADEIHEDAINGLVEKGVVERQDTKLLWVFKARKYPIIDGAADQEVKIRLFDVLMSNSIPSPRDVIVINLAVASGILDALVPPNEMKRLSDRIEQVRALNLIGQNVVNAIRDIEVAIAIATAPLF